MADFLSSSSSNVPLGANASTTQTLLPDWYTNYAQQVLSNQAAVSAQPYMPYQGPRQAGFTPDQQAGFDAARTGATGYQPTLDTATGAAQSTLGMSALSAAQPSLNQGVGYLQQSTSPTGIGLASPFLGAAGQSSATGVGALMSPYTDAVVNRIGVLGNRNLTENLLPAIGDQFVGAGGFGGSRQAEAIGRAFRDTQEGISAEQAKALEAGYGTALQTSTADLARQAQLAGTAGGLGTAQQGALQAAGSGIAGVGGQVGNLSSADRTGTLAGASQLGALAQQQQTQALTGAGALQSIGAQQQALQQASMDTAYADFLRQQGYDQTQIDAMTKTGTALAPTLPKSTLQEGYAPYNPSGSQSPSTLQTLAGLVGALW